MSGDIAVVGLGQMGAGIAASLARAGRAVLGVDPGTDADLPGVERVSLPEALDRCEVLVLSLPGPAQVEAVLAGPDGLLARDAPPRLVIDTSTSDPVLTRDLGARLAASGHVLADAPVSGGPSGAREGALTVFLGCADDQLDRVQAQLTPLVGQLTHVGGVGAGHTAKLVNNLLCGIHLSAAREAWHIARAGGIDPSRLFAAVNRASGRSAVTEVNVPRWVLTGSYDSGFPVGLMARDVGLAADMARQLGLTTPMSATAVAQWERLLDDVGPDADFNRMVDS